MRESLQGWRARQPEQREQESSGRRLPFIASRATIGMSCKTCRTAGWQLSRRGGSQHLPSLTHRLYLVNLSPVGEKPFPIAAEVADGFGIRGSHIHQYDKERAMKRRITKTRESVG